MTGETAFDLYTFIHILAENAWLEAIYIFGSRRYLTNTSFGSDIDLLLVPNNPIATSEVRKLIEEPYIDAFLLDGNLAISTGNETRINVSPTDIPGNLGAVLLWSRSTGWNTGQDYRLVSVLPHKVPSPTIATAGAHPIILFCALTSEFNSVLQRLPPGKTRNDPRLPPYYVTHIQCKSGRKRLVITAQTGVASVNAGITATRILDYFDRAELAILLGITAGLKGRGASLGDILVPTATVDVESGKLTPKGKEKAGLTIPMSPYLQRAVATWQNTSAWSTKWRTRKSGKYTMPAVHSDCTLACTSSVIAYNKAAQSFREQHRKILGIEMEALGVASATVERCPLLVIKSISDWADRKKDNKWHRYCMQVSADFTLSLLEQEII